MLLIRNAPQQNNVLFTGDSNATSEMREVYQNEPKWKRNTEMGSKYSVTRKTHVIVIASRV